MGDTRVTPEPERKERPVGELTRGMWVDVIDEEGDSFGEAEVLHVEVYDGDSVLLMYRPPGDRPKTLLFFASTTMPLLTDAEAKHARERVERLQLAEDLRNLAQAIIQHQLPFADLMITVALDTRAEVNAVAEALDLPTQPQFKTGLQASWPKGRQSFEPGLLLTVHTYEAAPEPESLVPAPIAKHYETNAWKGDTPGTCGAECACGVTYDGFDSLGEAVEFLKRHIADPAGVEYTRADDEPDDPTPVSPARVPAHIGGVTEHGLVDETEAVADERAVSVDEACRRAGRHVVPCRFATAES